jgi:Ca2+:H+ antiporter
LRCTKCEGFRWGTEDCQRCYWDQGNALTDPFYLSSVKPFSYLCCVFLVTAYVIGLWYTLRTHAAQIWDITLHGPEFQQTRVGPIAPITNWRDNIPDEPFLKRIGERMSNRFQRDGPSEPAKQDGTRISSFGSSLAAEDSALFVRNVAEVAAAAATLAVQHSQDPTPNQTPVIPPTSPSKHEVRARHSADWGHENVEGGGHDAPNWGRTKSSVVLLGATILYAIIAGIFFLDWLMDRDSGGYGGCGVG